MPLPQTTGNTKKDTTRCLSRRVFLQQSLALTVLSAAPKPSFASAAASRKKLAYVASDGENGKGIYLAAMNPVTGDFSLIRLVADAHGVSWLCLDPTGRYLFAANEQGDSAGKSGSVTAFAVDRASGDLHLLNVVSSEGAGPAHLSVDASGKYVFVANYAGGSIAVLSILAGGLLGLSTDVHQDTGSVGPGTASSGPPGSFAFSGHDGPHAHMIQADPGNRFVLQTDLGQDRIYVFRLDSAAGKLTPLADTPFASLPPGDGPRHFAFHRNGRWLYSLQEESSTVAFFHFDPETGALHPQQSLSTLPPGFQGTSFASEILLSPDQRFLYAANRLHDTIAVFSIGVQGKLDYVGETSTMGDYPRHIQIAPGGAFMYVCNQHSDSITAFRMDRKTGRLSFTGHYLSMASPACIVFMT